MVGGRSITAISAFLQHPTFEIFHYYFSQSVWKECDESACIEGSPTDLYEVKVDLILAVGCVSAKKGVKEVKIWKNKGSSLTSIL